MRISSNWRPALACLLTAAAWAAAAAERPAAAPRRVCPLPGFVDAVQVQDGVALVEAGDVLCGVDPDTLAERWRTRLCSRGLYVDDGLPRYVVAPGAVLVWRMGRVQDSGARMVLEALDIRSGRSRWRYDAGAPRHIPPACVVGDALLLEEGRGEESPANRHVACLDLTTAQRRWRLATGSSFFGLRIGRTHVAFGYGPKLQTHELTSGREVAWEDVPEEERLTLQRESYFKGKLRCTVTELWSDGADRIVHINARHVPGCGLDFGQDVILRAGVRELVDPAKPETAAWTWKPDKAGSPSHVAGAVAHGENLIVLMNPFTSAKDQVGWVRCLRRGDGHTLWSQTSVPIESPPALLGHALLFATDSAIHALDAGSGKELWSHPTQGRVRQRPVVLGAAAVFGDEKHLFALDAAGRTVWRRGLVGGLRAEPIVTGQRLLVASATLALIDGTTGRPVVPEREVPASAVGAAQPVTDADTAYILTRSGRVHAIDKARFTERWRAEALPTISRAFYCSGSLALAGNAVCAAAGQKLAAFDRKTGRLLWQRGFARLVIGVTCTDELVIAIADQVYTIRLADGAILRQFKPQYHLTRYLWYHTSMDPVSRDGRLYFTDWFNLYCLDLTTGEKLWSTRVAEDKNDRVFCLPAHDGRRFVYTTRDRALYSVDLATGERRRLATGAPCLGGFGPLAIIDDQVYFPTTYLDLVRVLSAADGSELAAILLTERTVSPLLALGRNRILGGLDSLVIIDPARRAVAGTLLLRHPARYLLAEDGTILVVDQGLKEYGIEAR